MAHCSIIIGSFVKVSFVYNNRRRYIMAVLMFSNFRIGLHRQKHTLPAKIWPTQQCFKVMYHNQVCLCAWFCFVCLFVLGFNVSLTLSHSYCDGTCMRQVRVLPHWNAPVAGTWQENSTQSHYKLTPGQPAIFPSTHLLMPSVSKGTTCTIFLRLLVCRGWGSNPSERSTFFIQPETKLQLDRTKDKDFPHRPPLSKSPTFVTSWHCLLTCRYKSARFI